MKVEKIISRSLVLLLISSSLFSVLPLSAAGSSSVSINTWWPTNGAHVTGTQPFKAVVPNLDVSQYDMFWQVDGGQWNWMDNNYTDYQHKEADVNVSQWNWHGSGPYVVNFIARQNGVVIAQQQETIYVDNGQPTPAPAPAPVPTPTPTPTVSIVAATTLTLPSPIVAPTVGMKLYVSPNSSAAQQASAWAASNPAGAAAMQTLASQPTAVWFGEWNSDVQNDVRSLVSAAQSSNATPVLVAYNIPERDCGGFSAGGSDNPAGYTAWIQSFAQGLGSAPALVVLEPDALADLGCLSPADQATRLQLLSMAVSAIKKDPNAKVYLDAGHSNWIDAATMAKNLAGAGVAQADGFSLNVSNFMATSDETNYGQQISQQLSSLVGQTKHFVIDTSRNGSDVGGQWCNPSSASVGTKPTTETGNSLIDAYLWVKTPGESDGSCNGGPSAGQWWPNYAVSLVQNAH